MCADPVASWSSLFTAPQLQLDVLEIWIDHGPDKHWSPLEEQPLSRTTRGCHGWVVIDRCAMRCLRVGSLDVPLDRAHLLDLGPHGGNCFPGRGARRDLAVRVVRRAARVDLVLLNRYLVPHLPGRDSHRH